MAHVNDPGLGVNEGFAHTWYEYVPPVCAAAKKKRRWCFYFHGIGCVPLYGAEQSGWHDIADRGKLYRRISQARPQQGVEHLG